MDSFLAPMRCINYSFFFFPLFATAEQTYDIESDSTDQVPGTVNNPNSK